MRISIHRWRAVSSLFLDCSCSGFAMRASLAMRLKRVRASSTLRGRGGAGRETSAGRGETDDVSTAFMSHTRRPGFELGWPCFA